MYSLRDLGEVLRTTGKLLVFEKAVVDRARLGPLYIAVGLVFTWLAGIGRHWDNPRLPLWQHLGLDSVVYVFVFSALLWLILWPMKPAHWRYSTVLIFVTMTAPPAFLYFLPGRLFSDPETAGAIKVWLLVIVAGWRVLLLGRFLYEPAGLRNGEIFVATLLPLTLIVATLSVLNLDRAVFDIMGGRRAPTAEDSAYAVLLVISVLSMCALPFVAAGYAYLCWARRKRRQAAPVIT
jgi:hypothetical protein